MNHSRLSLRILVVVLGALAFTSVAHAQASRTWVSGVGDDANPCSRTAPCKTFAGAISKTAAGGEIDCLDPGGFGAVTITKAMTLNCEGTLGSVLVSGTNGIVVQAGPSDIVRFIDIKIVGLNTGINGINYLSGKQVVLDGVKIYDFPTSCINVSNGTGLHLVVNNTTMNNCGTGVNVTGSNNRADVNNAVISGGNFGLVAQNGSVATIRNSDISFETTGVQAGPGASSIVDVDSSNISFNSTGVQGNGASTFVNLGNSFVSFSLVAGANPNGGGISTWGDNRFANNVSDGVIPGGGGITITKK